MISCFRIRNIISCSPYKAWKALRFFAMNSIEAFNMATGNLREKRQEFTFGGNMLASKAPQLKRQSVKQIYSFLPVNEDKSVPVLLHV